MSDFSGAVGSVIVVASMICLLGVIYPFRPFRTRRRALNGFGLCVLGLIAFAVLLAPPPAGEPATQLVGPAAQDLPEDAQLVEPTPTRLWSSSERFFTATDNLPEPARNLVAWVGTVPADVATLGMLGTFIVMITLCGLWLQEMGARRRATSEVAALRARFAPVLDLDAAIAERLTEKTRLDDAIGQTRAEYAEKRRLFDTLKHQLAVYDERLGMAEMGVYEPHFDFGDPERYRQAVLAKRDEQKAMIRAKSAVRCETQWQVEGSKSKGETMVNRQMRLTLRAFNNECEAAIANVRWNNVETMERRISNAAEQIDKANASLNMRIEPSYVRLKLEELWLTHEHREAIKAEREERAEAARLQREEQRLIRDAEKAEAEETRYQALLDKARAEAVSATGDQLARLQARIASLSADLAAAHAESERARAMAEMTRTGFVYVISNVGSFGEDVVKIGLTRRLDPDDRVRELGDASVPFAFDTHAMIYSDDAPALEAALHAAFGERRVNAANTRKEFFRVSLEEVEQTVARLAPDANFMKDREAQEYHETLARRRQLAARIEAEDQALPLAI